MRLKDTTISEINRLAKARIPFLFLIDFSGKHSIVQKLDDINTSECLYYFGGFTNQSENQLTKEARISKIDLLSFEDYQAQFDQVQSEISFGNTYLINLTTETKIETSADLQDIFYASKAAYKIYLKNQFVCFSPESFIKIKNNKISSYPMKGTIDASLDNAENTILNDEKEKAEHYTIVDLIRNDLNLVAKNVRVENFRYIQEIDTQKGKILQVSSEICGDLPEDWNENLGNLLSKILPAGSISGAPKEKTVEIINQVESQQRGFYTGIAGIFDGKNLDSAVLIRFIEKRDKDFYYKSGGGITHASIAEKEYQELAQKIYIPI